MYEKFYKFQRLPFESTPDPDFFFEIEQFLIYFKMMIVIIIIVVVVVVIVTVIILNNFVIFRINYFSTFNYYWKIGFIRLYLFEDFISLTDID